MKQRSKILICIIIILTLFIILYSRRTKDYNIIYNVDSYEIIEKYDKKSNMYYFSATKGEDFFEIAINSNYMHKKKIINTVTDYNDDNIICIYMKSNNLNTYPICKRNNEYIAYSAIKTNDDFNKLKTYKQINDKFGNIEINSLIGNSFAIWNHYGFDFISNQNHSINVLEKESYMDNNSFIVDEYIILPDYSQEYHFNRVYIINLKNGNVSEWDLGLYINYDYYVLGIKDKKAYIVDRKDKIEYEINPNKKKISIISKNGIGKIWNDNWQEESVVKLSNGDYSFSQDNIFDFKIVDNKLYARIHNSNKDILISNKSVDKIIYSNNSDVFYLSKNELYHFSFISGETLCMKYSEFEFNKGLSIYIY